MTGCSGTLSTDSDMVNEATVSGQSGSPDASVVFVSNELVRAVVSSSGTASTAYLRENRETLTDALTMAVSENRLNQFVAEFHDRDQGTRAILVFDLRYDQSQSVETEEAPVSKITEALPDIPPNEDVVVLAWPVVDGIDHFDVVEGGQERIESFGAEEIEVQVGVL